MKQEGYKNLNLCMMGVQSEMKKSLIIKISLVIAFVVIAVVGIILMTNAMRCTPPCVQMKEGLTAHEKATMTWRWTALVIYLFICFYDFMFVPIWYGLNRPDISLFMEIINSTEEPMVQILPTDREYLGDLAYNAKKSNADQKYSFMKRLIEELKGFG